MDGDDAEEANFPLLLPPPSHGESSLVRKAFSEPLKSKGGKVKASNISGKGPKKRSLSQQTQASSLGPGLVKPGAIESDFEQIDSEGSGRERGRQGEGAWREDMEVDGERDGDGDEDGEREGEGDGEGEGEGEGDGKREVAEEWSLHEESRDDVLKTASVLALEEVIQRRMKRIRKLIKLYHSQYWALIEEMRAKHRKFYLRTGRSGWREETEAETARPLDLGFRDNGRPQEPHAPDKPANVTLHCAASGPCLAKPLALSVFCLNHILLEPRQKLYKPCSFVIRSGSGGSVHCGRPVLCAVSPLLCTEHQETAKKLAKRAIKKTTPPSPSPSLSPSSRGKEYIPGNAKGSPKFHLIINEYVRAIQRKRRHLAAMERRNPKEVIKIGSFPS